MNGLSNIFLMLLLAATPGCQSSSERTGKVPARQRAPQQLEVNKSLEKAENGDAEAQYNVGKHYADHEQQTHLGYSVGPSTILYKNYLEASKWLKLSAAQGHEKAKTLLIEIENNQATQAAQFEEVKAKAEGGDPEAQVNLGYLYESGVGIAADLGKAVEWWNKGVEQNYPPAQVAMGLYCRHHGKGWTMDIASNDYISGKRTITDNMIEAARWYRKAAEQGDARGQILLGDFCIESQNYVEAYMWEYLAFSQGGTAASSAVRYLGSVIPNVTPAQIDEAKQLAHEFKAVRR